MAGLAIWPITIEFLEFRGITNQNYMVGAATKVSARIGNKNLRFEAERKKKGVDRHETKPGEIFITVQIDDVTLRNYGRIGFNELFL